MNKKILLLACTVLLGSCAGNRFLPERENIGLSPYGSFIRLHTPNDAVQGELLTLNGNTLIIRSTSKPYLRYIDTTTVTKYYIKFCKTRSYAIMPIISISHGLFMIFTVPVNSIIALIMKSNDIKESKYKNLPFTEAALYARFPDGLPEDFSER